MNEIEMWNQSGAKGQYSMNNARTAMKQGKHLGRYSIGQGHTLYQVEHDDHVVFIVVNAENKITAELVTVHNGAALQVDGAWADRANVYPMYKVYAYIVKRLNITVMSDNLQSDAGKAIWHKLSALPGITVFGWDTKARKAVNLGNKLSADTDADTHTDVDIMDNPDNRALNTVLVAIKK